MVNRRALCVGIDGYSKDPLQGCVSDASRLASVLSINQDGSPNFDCMLLTAELNEPSKLTRSELCRNLNLLFRRDAEIALLHFAGHGTANNLDGYLVTQDSKSFDEGVPMADVMKLANDSPAKEVVILIDCCHSGVMGNLPVVNNQVLLREGVSILTASRGDEPSVEMEGGGVFTSLVVDALEGGAADILGDVSTSAIYAYVEAALGAWDQRPLFKAHVSRLSSLRKCEAPIPIEYLRNLPSLFPLPAEDIILDPSFEPSSEAPIEENVKVFRILQALNRVHLVTPIDTVHMYDAAIESTSCRLTPSGRYYWRLARDSRI